MTDPQAEAARLPDRLRDEADLCRNDGANDIAALLDEAAAEVERLKRDAVPREPTQAMINAGVEYQCACGFDPPMIDVELWRRMFDAARAGHG